MTDTTSHRATAEQWADAEKLGHLSGWLCLLELRARVESLEIRDREDPDAWTGVRRANAELRARIEALEAGATCPHIVSSDEGTSYCGLAEQQAATPPELAPAGSLVDRVGHAIANTDEECLHDSWSPEARAAILAVAEWLDTKGQHGCSLWLREEVKQ